MLDSDNMSFKNDEFDFSAMFDELAVLMREKVSNPEVEFICENPLQTLMVKTDRERLTQVIGNLITNAAKFTGQGYIKMGYARKMTACRSMWKILGWVLKRKSGGSV